MTLAHEDAGAAQRQPDGVAGSQAEGERLRSDEDIAVQLLRIRRRGSGVARLRPEPSAEAQGCVREGNPAIILIANEGVQSRQTYVRPNPSQFAPDLKVRHRRHYKPDPALHAARHPLPARFGRSDPIALCQEPERSRIQHNHADHR